MILPRWLVLCVYAAGLALAGLLLVQHWLRMTPYMYLLILLACPLMHLFMHHARGGHHHEGRKTGSGPSA